MSACVLSNELKKTDKMRGLLSILSLFRSKIDEFNKTGAGKLDSSYHIALKLLQNNIFGVKMSRFCHLLHNVLMDVIRTIGNLSTSCDYKIFRLELSYKHMHS